MQAKSEQAVPAGRTGTPYLSSIKARMYLQCAVAVLPLLLLLGYQGWQSIGEADRLSSTSVSYDRALEVSASFKKFLDGVSDAVDSGRLGESAFAALESAASVAAARDLTALPREGGKTQSVRMAAIHDRLKADRSVATLMALRPDIVAIGKAVDDDVRTRQIALADEVSAELARASTDVGIIAAVGLLATIVTVLLIRRLAANLTGALRSAIEFSQRIATGRLDGKIALRTGNEIDELLAALDAMNGQLRSMVGAVKTTADGMCGTTVAVSREVEAMTDRVHRQSDRIAAISGEMDRLASSVTEVARNAKATSEAASTTREIVDKGNAYTRMGLAATDQIVHSVGSTGRSIELLSTAITDIGSVTQLIGGVAKQTGLLALNAAIEAARAGEAGRGFAIVADEVSKLARESATSADDIGARIRAVQAGTEASVAAMGEVAGHVSAGAEYTRGASENFADIARAAVDVENRSKHIADAATEQTLTTGRIAGNMDEIGDLARDNAGTIEQLAASARQLSDGAIRLRAVVDRFAV